MFVTGHPDDALENRQRIVNDILGMQRELIELDNRLTTFIRAKNEDQEVIDKKFNTLETKMNVLID